MKLGVEAAVVAGRILPGDVEVSDGRIDRFGVPGSNGRGIAAPGAKAAATNSRGVRKS